MSRRLTLTAAGLLLAAGATAGAVVAGQSVAPAPVPVHATVVDSTTGLPAATPSATDTGTASPAATPTDTAAPAATSSAAAPTQGVTTTTTNPQPAPAPTAPPARPTWSCSADGNTCTQHVEVPAGVAQPVAPPLDPAPVAPVAPGLGDVPPQG